MLWFYYDSTGTRVGFSHGNDTYYYIYNQQGDVIAIASAATGKLVATYTYDAWGKIVKINGQNPDSIDDSRIAKLNPFRYRGYYYDTETGYYYLQSRYYDPDWGRFINADAFTSTDISGILSANMFAYCENNPVNRSDPSGMFWKEIGNFFKKVGAAIVDFAKSTFGAESSTSVTTVKSEFQQLPDPLPITVKTGVETTETISKHGDSSKPVSIYANRDATYSVKSSSAGIKLNAANHSLNFSLGIDNIGIYGSHTNGNTTNSFGLRINLFDLKVGFECSSAIKWDNTTETNYTNVSASGWALVAVYMLVSTGQTTPSPSNAY